MQDYCKIFLFLLIIKLFDPSVEPSYLSNVPLTQQGQIILFVPHFSFRHSKQSMYQTIRESRSQISNHDQREKPLKDGVDPCGAPGLTLPASSCKHIWRHFISCFVEVKCTEPSQNSTYLHISNSVVVTSLPGKFLTVKHRLRRENRSNTVIRS